MLYKHVLIEAALVEKGFKKLFGKTTQHAAPKLIFRDQKNYTEFQINTAWGSSVRGFSLGHGEGQQVLGEGYDHIVLAEGDLIPPELYRRRIKRALDRRAQKERNGYQNYSGSVSIYTTSHFGEGIASSEFNRVTDDDSDEPEVVDTIPIGKGRATVDVKRRAKDYGIENRPWYSSVYVEQASVLANPAYSFEAYEASREEMIEEDPDAFYEQWHGEVRQRSGRVIKEFQKHRHVIPPPTNEKLCRMRLGIGIDTGVNFAAVLCGIDKNNVKYILGEAFTRRAHIYESAEELMHMCVDVLAEAFDVKTSGDVQKDFSKVKNFIDCWFVDKASQSKLELSEALDVPLEYAKLPLEGTLGQMRDLFSRDELYISEECVQWIKDVGRYVWRDKRLSENNNLNTSSHDHLIDAARYIICGGLIPAGPLEEEEKAPHTFEEAYKEHIKEQLDWKRSLREAEQLGIL